MKVIKHILFSLCVVASSGGYSETSPPQKIPILHDATKSRPKPVNAAEAIRQVQPSLNSMKKSAAALSMEKPSINKASREAALKRFNESYYATTARIERASLLASNEMSLSMKRISQLEKKVEQMEDLVKTYKTLVEKLESRIDELENGK